MDIPVINLTTSVLGYAQWQNWSYQPWATGLTGTDTWTSSALPPGMTLNAATGTLSGACATAGVYNVGLQVSNANGSSAPIMLTIGIDPRAFSAHSGVDLFIDTATGAVTATPPGTTAVTTTVPSWLFSLKEGDDLLLFVHFVRDGTILDLGALTELTFGMKQFEPERTLVLSTDFGRTGAGDETIYIAYIHFESADFKAALSDYESDTGTSFIPLAEIAWKEPNATDPKIGPDVLQRRSATFNVFASRAIVPE